MRRKINDRMEEDEINLSPMIDMVFILLIFFIVTTVFVEEVGFPIVKPPPNMEKKLEKNSIMIGITSDNTVIYGGNPIDTSSIKNRVARLLKDGDKPVIIHGDINSQSEKFKEVHREAKNGGAVIIHYNFEKD